MEQLRFLMIGAHPDDMELRCGGLAMRLRGKGHRVRFVSMTDGSAGHHMMEREALGQRRRKEAEAVAALLDIEYRIMPIPDGCLEPTLAVREMLIREIREFAPHVILTHRTADYHPDHRACGQLVMDCSYMMNVPLVCPDTPCPRLTPVILSAWDPFTRPVPFSPTVVVPVDDLVERKTDSVLCHVSQFYEWLPYIEGWDDVSAAPDFETKTALLRKRLEEDFRSEADRYSEWLPEGVRFAEIFEWNEYGAPLTDKMIRAMDGILCENKWR